MFLICRTIEDPELRGCFLEDVEVYEPLDGNMPWNTPDFQRYRGNGRRRVDYIMFSNHRTHLQQVGIIIQLTAKKGNNKNYFPSVTLRL